MSGRRENIYWRRIKNIYHLFEAIIANIYYRFPSRHIKVIGVTGTDGKTTTTSLIYHLLRSCGKKVSVINSVRAEIAGKIYDTGFHVTTPSAFFIQKFLRQAVDYGNEYFVLETTSLAIDQFRVWGIKFAVSVITNITPEHLYHHGSYDNYLKVKARLLHLSAFSWINKDDQSFNILRTIVPASCRTYGLVNPADLTIDFAKRLGKHLESFNKYNYLAAYGVCLTLGLNENCLIEGMSSFKLPVGRMEVVYDQKITAIVDFAHTPNAIFQALMAIREKFGNRRIIHVFGAAAERDDSKRPLMGEASGNFADIVILTEEDCRREDPVEICYQIGAGLEKTGFQLVADIKSKPKERQYIIIPNRKAAIELAVKISRSGDVLVFTGKGHERSLCRGKVEYPWDEKNTVLETLSQYGY